MGPNRNGMATGALMAGSLGCGRITQPGLRQRQGQVVLAQSGRPMQQPSMAILGQERSQLLFQPSGHGVGVQVFSHA